LKTTCADYLPQQKHIKALCNVEQKYENVVEIDTTSRWKRLTFDQDFN